MATLDTINIDVSNSVIFSVPIRIFAITKSIYITSHFLISLSRFLSVQFLFLMQKLYLLVS
uniref:Uncharacterized protein n=1 Tax=uncultured marine virus TaxID=186617 RepID=A0A0F7L496_9VIRU|nr:hypothetical protein [uncultured marine virus]